MDISLQVKRIQSPKKPITLKLKQNGSLQVVFGGSLGGMLSLSTVEKPEELQSKMNAQKQCCQTSM